MHGEKVRRRDTPISWVASEGKKSSVTKKSVNREKATTSALPRASLRMQTLTSGAKDSLTAGAGTAQARFRGHRESLKLNLLYPELETKY